MPIQTTNVEQTCEAGAESPLKSPDVLTPEEIWSTAKAKVRSIRKEEADLWGGVTDGILTRYYLNTATDAEKRLVDERRMTHPRVAEALNILKEIAPSELPED
jgi:hypothetical protein